MANTRHIGCTTLTLLNTVCSVWDYKTAALTAASKHYQSASSCNAENKYSNLQLAEKESQLSVADRRHVQFEQQISALHAELSQQRAEVTALQAQLEAVSEREMAASVAADLDQILDDPDQLPAEAHQLMSSLRRETPGIDRELPAKLHQLQKQLQKKEEEMRERDSTMQQLLRGADRIEDVQKATLVQLADAESEVLPHSPMSSSCIYHRSSNQDIKGLLLDCLLHLTHVQPPWSLQSIPENIAALFAKPYTCLT